MTDTGRWGRLRLRRLVLSRVSAGVGGAAALLGTASSPLASYLVRAVTALAAAALLISLQRRERVRLGPARPLLAAALLVGVVSGLIAAVQTIVNGVAPVAGLASHVYLGYAPLAVAGFAAVPWVRHSRSARIRVLTDAVIASGALWFLVLLLVPASVAADLNHPSRLVDVLYVIAPTAAVGCGLSVLPHIHVSARSFVSRASVGISALGFGDVVYSWQVAQGTYRPTGLAAVLNEFALLLLLFAALTPTSAPAEASHAGELPRQGTVLLPFVPVAAAVVPLIVHIVQGRPLPPGTSLPLALVACAILARQVLVARETGALVTDLASEAERAHELARTDVVTGLPNRRGLEAGLRACAEHGSSVVLALVDVVGFRTVNDNHGHASGDELLRRLGARLLDVSDAELVARVGPDQFAVVVPCRCVEDTVVCVAAVERALRQALRAPLPLPLRSWPIRVAIGVTHQAPTSSPSAVPETELASSLLVQADLALRDAQRAADGTHVTVRVLDEANRARGMLTSRLLEALTNPDPREFTVVYQPVWDVAVGRVASFEALLRWTRAGDGAISPGVFIPLAHEAGSIAKLTDLVLRTVASDLASWRTARPGPSVPVAVNLAPGDVVDASLPGRLLAVLAEHLVPTELLRVEVTEDGELADFEAARTTVAALQEAGVRVAIDDFGTGWSSLRHLRRLRPDLVKIDREFVQAAVHEPSTALLVAGVVDLAAALGISCVAEGVETPEELDLVSGMGVSLVQGFLLGRPAPASEVPGLMRSRIATVAEV